MKRALGLGVAAATMLVTLASPASGVAFVQGFTWYSDGSLSKTGPSGTVITAFATGAARSRQFMLLMVRPNPDVACSDAHAPTAVNPGVRASNDRGFIPNTAGPVAGTPSGTPGEYQICFYELTIIAGDHRTGTSPAFFTIV